MKYFNQLDYRHIPYYINAKEEPILRNVALSGCGPCSICMMVEILTDKALDIVDCIKIAEECAANHSIGTDMNVLAPVIAERFDLDYRNTADLDETIRHLQNGGQVVVHVCVPKGETVGLFTKGGHYMSIISTDGKEFCILDPSYTPEKFQIPERAGKVNDDHAPFLYCDVNILHGQTGSTPFKYHLFSRTRS